MLILDKSESGGYDVTCDQPFFFWEKKKKGKKTQIALNIIFSHGYRMVDWKWSVLEDINRFSNSRHLELESRNLELAEILNVSKTRDDHLDLGVS